MASLDSASDVIFVSSLFHHHPLALFLLLLLLFDLGPFSVPLSLRSAASTGRGGVVACTEKLPGWRCICRFLDVGLTPAFDGCVFLTDEQTQKHPTGSRLGSIFAATAVRTQPVGFSVFCFLKDNLMECIINPK